MVPPAQVNYISSPSEDKRSSVTKTVKKTVQLNQNLKHQSRNAARERYRVKSLRTAFQSLQQCLPSVPPNTKLPKLDVLVLAASYISHLTRILNEHDAQQQDYSIFPADFELIEGSFSILTDSEVRSPSWEKSYLHPVKKWPMRSRLYAGVDDGSSTDDCNGSLSQQKLQWN